MPQPTPDGSPILTPDQAERIRQKQIANIVRKIQSGRTATARELALIDSYGGSPTDSEGDWVSSYAKVGKAVGLHRASLERIVKDYKGDPMLPRPRDNGDHHIPSWRQFIAARGIQCKSSTSVEAAGGEGLAPGEKSKGDLEREKLIEQILTIRRKREGADKKFLESIAEQVRTIGEDLKARLKAILEDELPPKLAPLKTAGAIRAEMKKVNDKICAEFDKTAARISTRTDAGTSIE